MCKEKDSHRDCGHIHSYKACAHTPTQTGENNNRSEGPICKTYVNEYLHNREILRRNSQKLQQAKEKMRPARFGFVLIKLYGLYVESGEVLKCYYVHSFAKERELKFIQKFIT